MSQFFACKHKDDELRKVSSSGGFFTALAENILLKGGVVYGASFTDDYRGVNHICVTTIENLCKLRGPKYITSRIGNSYKGIKEKLNEKTLVLFSGTPCQIYGLKKYLGVEYSNLITVDLVCHGVADSHIYNYYLNYLEQKYHSNISFVSFRDKNKSWRKPDLLIRFYDGRELREAVSDNSFMKGFMQNLYLRDSCTHCHFKNFMSGSDFTIGDFWGSVEIPSLSQEDLGVSIVAVHTPQGMHFFNTTNIYLKDIVELEEDKAFLFNESYKTSSQHHPKRTEFYANFLKYDFEDYVNKLLFQPKKKESLFNICIKIAKKAIKKTCAPLIH